MHVVLRDKYWATAASRLPCCHKAVQALGALFCFQGAVLESGREEGGQLLAPNTRVLSPKPVGSLASAGQGGGPGSPSWVNASTSGVLKKGEKQLGMLLCPETKTNLYVRESYNPRPCIRSV